MMKEHPYRELANAIHAPAELEERVIRAARERQSSARRPVLRWGVCAACAVLAALALTLYPRPEGSPGTLGFGLTAYAADTQTSYGAGANATLVFAAGEETAAQEGGSYTGCLFQVTGEGIETLTLSLSRGELYRRQGEESLRLGPSVTEPYDPAVYYGFWIEEEALPVGLDALDGAVLTVAASYPDGTVEEKRYTLSTGLLRQVCSGGAQILEPALAGDVGADFYGLYAASAEESRFFRWPLAGADTVSMSNPFGAVGKATGAVHYGIDIPGRSGMSVTAAADGTVRETGFDPEQGNYLVLDHGDGLTTVYAQCKEVLVTQGQSVRAGETMASLGSTGMSTGAHLCFQVWQDGTAQNPVAYFESSVRRQLKMA